MKTIKSRFEAWADKHYFDLTEGGDHNNYKGYFYENTRGAWELWQEMELLKVEPQGELPYPNYAYGFPLVTFDYNVSTEYPVQDTKYWGEDIVTLTIK
jgi:hypothetical protein